LIFDCRFLIEGNEGMNYGVKSTSSMKVIQNINKNSNKKSSAPACPAQGLNQMKPSFISGNYVLGCSY